MHEIQASQVLAVPGTSKADVVAFDELFQKFCGAGGSNQFAYFEECWSKPGRKKAGKASNGALADAQEGALAPVEKEGKEPKERQPKRPLFDPLPVLRLVSVVYLLLFLCMGVCVCVCVFVVCAGDLRSLKWGVMGGWDVELRFRF